MDPIPRTHRQNSALLVGQFPRFCTLRVLLTQDGRWRGGEKAGSKIREDMFTGSLHVRRPLWMKESFFLSEEGGGPSTAGWKREHTADVMLAPNRGFFQSAGEAERSEVWKPDTRMVKSSSNGP